MLSADSLGSSEDNGFFWLPKAHKNRTNPSSLHHPSRLPLAFSETLPRQISYKARVWWDCVINLLSPTGKYDLSAVQYGPYTWQVFIPCLSTSHRNFTIQKTPVIGGGWNIWMLQTLSTGCLYHHLQNRCTRNEGFSDSRNSGWQRNELFKFPRSPPPGY